MVELSPAPIAPAARINPEHSGLDASFQHAGGWDALSITASPQVVELVITNTMSEPVALNEAVLVLMFRPGVLIESDKIALAPQSEPEWHLSHAKEADGLVRLQLQSANTTLLGRGESIKIRFLGVSVSTSGGTRGTRVQLSYNEIVLSTGRAVSGHCLMHVPLLRRHPPVALTKRSLSVSGSAMEGPFMCGIVKGRDLINDGLTQNDVVIRLMNVSKAPVVFEYLEDYATRLRVSWRTGVSDAEFGLLGSDGSHLSLRCEQRGWDVSRHTIHRVEPGALAPGEFVELIATIHTNAVDGLEELRVTFENLRDFDDGDLRLPLTLGPMAHVNDTIEMVRDVKISRGLTVEGVSTLQGTLHAHGGIKVHGANGSLSVAGVSTMDGTLHAHGGIKLQGANSTLSVDGISNMSGKLYAGSGISVEADGLNVKQGDLTVGRGDLDLKKGDLTLSDGDVEVKKGGLTLNKGHLNLKGGHITLPHEWKISATETQLNFTCGDTVVLTLHSNGNAWLHRAFSENAGQG